MNYVITKKNIAIWIIISTLLFAIIGLATSPNQAQAKSETTQSNFAKNQTISEELPNLSSSEEALKAIENIPKSVVNQGHEAILEWFKSNIKDPATLAVINSNLESSGKYQVKSVLGCVSAVGAALVGLAWAPAKLLKIKKALKALGGVTTFVKKSIQYYNVYKKRYRSKTTAWKKATAKAAKKASPQLRDALLSFFGITAIIDSCT
ncbi:hypothetical protein [Sporolactobacillus terrae]|uniref:hypothetical protein n=1 Tax=Sporolactobacillus terrae TaxID=269673 RepID=UPI0006887E2B|nr:hypothetical protein [Sporolactobacillus terrae]